MSENEKVDWKKEFLKRYKPAHPVEKLIDENESYVVTDTHPRELNNNKVFFEVKRINDGELFNIIAWTDTLSTMLDCGIFQVMRTKDLKKIVILRDERFKEANTRRVSSKEEK